MVFPLAAAAALAALSVDVVRDPKLIWPLLALLATVLCLWNAAALQSALLRSPVLLVYSYLPIAHQRLFDVQARHFLAGTAWSLAGLALLVQVTAPAAGYPGWAYGAGFAVVILQWALSIWAALALVSFRPQWPYGLVKGLLFLFLIGTFVGKRKFLSAFLSQLEGCRSFVWFVPAGWLSLAFERFVLGGESRMAVLILLAVAPLAWTPSLLKGLRSRYEPPEPSFEALSGDEEEDAEPEAAEPIDRRKVASALADRSPGGPAEGPVGRRFGSEELRVLEFMLGGPAPVARPLRRAVVVLAVGLLAGALIPAQRTAFVLVSGGIALLLAVPFFGGPWAGLEERVVFGLKFGLHAPYPVGYREFERVFLKFNTIRCLCALPLGAGVGMAGGWALGAPVLPSAWLGAKVVLAALLLQHAILVMRVSPCTNDSSGAPGFFLLVVLLTLVLLALAGVFVFVSVSGWDVASGIAAGVVSRLFAWSYRRRLERMGFDLVGVPSEVE